MIEQPAVFMLPNRQNAAECFSGTQDERIIDTTAKKQLHKQVPADRGIGARVLLTSAIYYGEFCVEKRKAPSIQSSISSTVAAKLGKASGVIMTCISPFAASSGGAGQTLRSRSGTVAVQWKTPVFEPTTMYYKRRSTTRLFGRYNYTAHDSDNAAWTFEDILLPKWQPRVTKH
jgi:hypothetical protein